MFEKKLYSLMSSANSLAVMEGSRESVTSFIKTLNTKGPSTYITLANAVYLLIYSWFAHLSVRKL